MREKESGRSPIVRVGGLLVFGIIALLIYFRFPDTRLFAQEPPVQLPKPLKHEVTVTLKLIQVIVTDKKGNPVTGLKKEDFILSDNGKTMMLTEFEKHDLRLPAAPPAVEMRIAPTAVPAAKKYFVLFSSGIPGSFLHKKIIPSPGEGGKFNTDLLALYDILCRELATSNIAVYSLNTDPLLPPGALIPPPENETGAATLKTMAKVTGGQYFGNIFNYAEHLDKIRSVTGTYYVLGYGIHETWDGAFHKIQAKVNRPGCEVRAQAGYFSPRLFADYTELEKKMHLVDLALSPKPLSQLPIRLSMTAFFCSGGTADNLCCVAEIPVEKIREISKNKVETINLVFNAADEIVSMSRIEENFGSRNEKSAYLVTLHSVPPDRAYKCRVVVRDLETGRAAVAAAQPVFIAPSRGIQLYPPLFFVPERGARYIRAETAKSGKRESDVTLSRVFPFDSAQYAPQIEKRVRRNSEIWAGIRCRAVGPAPRIKLSAFLVDKITAEQIPIPLEVVAEKLDGDEAAFFVRLRIPAVEPEEYRFVLGAEDSASGAKSQLGCDFVIDEEES